MSLLQLSDIHFRDPYVLVNQTNGKYYLYGSTGQNVWEGPAIGFDVYVSEDLAGWEGPFQAFRPSPDFWSNKHFWAPEVYARDERYYMLASFKADNRCRATCLLIADTPLGPFEPAGDTLTPRDWECLDGTLYEDESGTPWMIFCREWLEVKDGEMYAVQLQADLQKAVSEPILLFRASEAPWSVGFGEDSSNYVTDGPFLHRMPNGELVMLWSTTGVNGYTMGLARSASGKVTGPWIQDAEPLDIRDGGHGMLFHKLDGTLQLTIHQPNKHPLERPVIWPIEVSNGMLQLAKPEE
jgi:arabinan endo-1,5-alpha-L-arabinosidase